MKKIIKLLTLILCILLIGCFDSGVAPEEYFDLLTMSINDVVTSDINLKNEIDGHTVIYDSSKPDVLSNDGKVTQGKEDVVVTLYITIVINDKEYTDFKTITVRGTDSYDSSSEVAEFESLFNSYEKSKYTDDNYNVLVSLFNEGKVKIETSKSKEDATKVINDYKVKFDAVEVNISTEEKLSNIENDLNSILEFNGQTVYSDLTLKTNSLYNSSIIWTSSNENVMSKDGVIGEVSEPTSVTISCKIVLDGVTYEGFSINLYVDKKQIPSYYSSINLNLSGVELKKELRTLITTTHKRILTYNDLRQEIAKTDKDPNNGNNLILLYTRVSVPSRWDGGTTWNREHVWPQSTGWSKDTAGGADIHHIRPTNNSANSSRGNKPFGEVSHTENNRKKVTISGYGQVDYGYANSNFFEPLDEVKGDIARIIFYLLVRYNDADSKPVTRVSQSMEMLLRWHEQDPVDDFELNRNEQSFKIQGNRNPFIDYEDFASSVFGVSTINLENNVYYYFKKEEFYI